MGDDSAFDCVVDLAQAQALRDAVGDDLVGAPQDIDIKFLFVGSVGTDRDYGRSGL